MRTIKGLWITRRLRRYIKGMAATVDDPDDLIRIWLHCLGAEGLAENIMSIRPGTCMEWVLEIYVDGLPESISEENRKAFLRKILCAQQAMRILKAADELGLDLTEEEEKEEAPRVKWDQPVKIQPDPVTVIHDDELEEKLGGPPVVAGQLDPEEISSARNQIRMSQGFKPIMDEEKGESDAGQ